MTANHARSAGQTETWTGWQKCLAAVLVVLGLGITVIAFVLLYGTITSLLWPYMGSRARAVPVCGEIAFAFLFANGVLLASRRAPSGILRGFLMASLAIGSLILNVWASRHSLPSATGHVVVVVAFFGVMLAGKSTIMILRGGKVRADAITAGEWIAHPLRSAELWRWMKAWGEPSRSAAQADYMVLLYARAIAQADPRIGRGFRWQHRLPVTLRYELSTGMLPDGLDSAGDWQEAIRKHVAKQLALLDRAPAKASRGATRDAMPGAVSVPAGKPSSRPHRRARKLDKSPEAEHARAEYRASVRRGDPLSDRALGEKFDRSRTWGGSRIAEVGDGPRLAKPAAAAEAR